MSPLDGIPAAPGVDRDRLILDHVPLLKHLVGRMSWELPASVDRDDVYGFGMLGLVAAADSWDPRRGLKFSTYAYPRIRGAILDELRKHDFLSRGQREKVRAVDRAVRELEQEAGLPPSPEQVAERLGVDADELDGVLLSARSASQCSLDESAGGELASLLRDPACEDPVGSAEWEETRLLLQRAIEDLPAPERTVIDLYYAEELLLREISEVLGVTESRVSQIHTRALYRLNRALSAALGAPT